MDIESAISGRRSVRKFLEEEIPDELIARLAQAAINAPSPGNQQGFHLYVTRKSSVKEQLANLVELELNNVISAAGDSPESMSGPVRFATWFKNAPAVIAVSTRHYRSPVDKTLLKAGYTEEEVDVLRCRPDLQGVGASIQNMLLTAYANGYGTCWLTGPMVARKQLEKFLNIHSPESLAAIIALGRMEKDQAKPERKPVEEFITFVD